MSHMSPDEKHIAYTSFATVSMGFTRSPRWIGKRNGSSGGDRPLPGPNLLVLNGNFLVYHERFRRTLWRRRTGRLVHLILPSLVTVKTYPLIQSTSAPVKRVFHQTENGRLLLEMSPESTRLRRPFPTGRKMEVSSGDGRPALRRDGKEIFIFLP